MHTFFDDLQLISSGVLPDCRIHINRKEANAYAVQLCRSGSMYYQIDREKRQIFEGPRVFWTSPHYRYRYGPGMSGSWNHCWVLFRGNRAESYFEEGLQHIAAEGHIAIHNLRKYEQLFDALHEASGSLSRLTQARGSLLLQELLLLLAEERAQFSQPESAEQRILQFANRIERSPEIHYDLKNEAQSMGLSYSHFRKCFKDQFKQTPHQFIIGSRMAIAKRYLQDYNLQIQEIGERVGYPDPTQFSTIFKKSTGQAPLNFRKEIQ